MEQNETIELCEDIKMSQYEAAELLKEALYRIEHKDGNYNGGSWSCGGAYWRLAKVLNEYVKPNLEKEEGKAHADFIIKTHGEITNAIDN